jgi:hypothetical protein
MASLVGVSEFEQTYQLSSFSDARERVEAQPKADEPLAQKRGFGNRPKGIPSGEPLRCFAEHLPKKTTHARHPASQPFS